VSGALLPGLVLFGCIWATGWIFTSVAMLGLLAISVGRGVGEWDGATLLRIIVGCLAWPLVWWHVGGVVRESFVVGYRQARDKE
jgi:hypothetical protein